MTTPQKRFFTKSHFALAQECPTKLYYKTNSTYANQKDDDTFLKALADGGFQIGALAKIYCPGGDEIETLDHDVALAQTTDRLKNESQVIYEAAIAFQQCFVRVDILKKEGNRISLIEVKAKSFDRTSGFIHKKSNTIFSNWRPYLLDVAFQTFVVQSAFPEFKVTPYLYLVDKTAIASVDGIHQKFPIYRKDGRAVTKIPAGLTAKDLGSPLMTLQEVSNEVKLLQHELYRGMSFENWINFLAKNLLAGTKIEAVLGTQCRECEFRSTNDLKDGFQECWNGVLVKSSDRPIFQLWNHRSGERFFQEKKLTLQQLQKDDIEPAPDSRRPGLSHSERQWLQVEKVQKGDNTPFLDREGMKREIASWKYPLHFIDFETAAFALPFHKGRRPYEKIAFQYSHHMIEENGEISHRSEYLDLKRNHFPNFEFLKALKQDLEKDSGTIFCYARHESDILREIYGQLDSAPFVDDTKAELKHWIAQLCPVNGTPSRELVDLYQLVTRYFYLPSTEGSNSLKYILPATLNESQFLKEKYSRPLYGAKNGISSRNFKNQVWVTFDEKGKVIDPYAILKDLSVDALDCIAEGGAAMTAYARCQFTDLTQKEIDRISNALLRYCELDTLAMVMLYEYWKDEIFR